MITPRMKITDLMQRKARGPTAATQGPGVPGGHKFWCSGCNGFRVHAVKLFARNEAIKGEVLRELALQREGTRLEVRLSQTQETPSLKPRLAIVCRTCGKTSVLVYQAGVWMPETWGKRLDDHVRRRTAELLGQLDRALMAAVTESPMSELPERESGVVEHMKGAVLKRLPELRDLTPEDVDQAIDAIRGKDADVGHGDAGDTAVSVQGIRGKKLSPPAAENPAPPPKLKLRDRDPAADEMLRIRLSTPPKEPRRKLSPRTKAKIAGWALSVPFLLMGALYALAWRGTYIWPIYYAIQPWWRPWMSEEYFWGLSIVVPAIIALAYAIRFRTPHGYDEAAEDIIDWRPETREKKESNRPEWMDEE